MLRNQRDFDQELDRNPDRVVETVLEQYRHFIARLVCRYVAQYERAISLQIDNPKFRKDVVEAILSCIITNAPNRKKRYSDIRRELLRVQREAVAAEKSLSRLRDAFNLLTPEYREQLDQHLVSVAKIAVSLVAKQVPWFFALSSVADLAGFYAEKLRRSDKGGAPKMAAFDKLVRGLARAFEQATGRIARVTWNDHRQCYTGRFMRLVEAVLPLARRLADYPERPMRCPVSERARGKYISEITRVGAGKKKPVIRNA